MDPALPTGPNQLGNLSEMYSLAEAPAPLSAAVSHYSENFPCHLGSFVAPPCSSPILHLLRQFFLLHQSEHPPASIHSRLPRLSKSWLPLRVFGSLPPSLTSLHPFRGSFFASQKREREKLQRQEQTCTFKKSRGSSVFPANSRVKCSV